MRTFKQLFLLLLLLAVAGLIGIQWWVRSSAGVSSIERRIKALTGLETTIGSVRLGWNLDFLVTDLALILKDSERGDQVLLEAPAVSVSGRCNKRVIRLSRPVAKAVQSQRGEWAPSILKGFADRDAFFEALLALSASLKRAFEVTDAVLVMQGADGSEIASYSGVNWYHAPARLKGRLGLMHNVFSLQCVDGKPEAMASEWLSDGQGTYFISAPDAVPVAKPSVLEQVAVLPSEEVVEAAASETTEKQAPVSDEEELKTE